MFISVVVWRFNRWRHHVDYRSFKSNELKRVKEEVPDRINNYGMKLITNKKTKRKSNEKQKITVRI